MSRRLAVTCWLLCAAASTSAQLVESIEVRVTNVDVVVTDRNGNRVAGLSKDDFTLIEDGKIQPITNFYEVRDAEAKPVMTADSATGVAPHMR